VTTDPRPPEARIAILADDLIWATRLADAVRRSGGLPHAFRSAEGLASALPQVDGCVIDLTARAYDGVAALKAARDAGVPVVAVGQHDDAALRRAARAAGADRVFAYRALHEHADRELGTWIERLGAPSAGDGA
jgi:DNA-binding response OmpR family regulator